MAAWRRLQHYRFREVEALRSRRSIPRHTAIRQGHFPQGGIQGVSRPAHSRPATLRREGDNTVPWSAGRQSNGTMEGRFTGVQPHALPVMVHLLHCAQAAIGGGLARLLRSGRRLE